jgi:hypothetical protein
MKHLMVISFKSTVLAVAFAVLPLAAVAQSLPHWNVTLPADPGTSTQKVALTATSLTIDSVFPQNKIHSAVPLKSIASITQPYLYKNKNWLIDLKLSPKATMTNTLTVVSHTESEQVDEVSLQFLKQSDAAAARAYLLAHLH